MATANSGLKGRMKFLGDKRNKEHPSKLPKRIHARYHFEELQRRFDLLQSVKNSARGRKTLCSWCLCVELFQLKLISRKSCKGISISGQGVFT